MAGWNSGENPASRVLGRDEATPGNLQKAITRLYGEHADEVAKEYASTTNDQALDAAAELASARFIAYSTWKWAQLAGKTGGKPVYRYYYSRPRPAMNPQMGNVTAGLAGGIVQTTGPAPAAPPSGAVHSAEIEYALGNLATNKVFAWTPDDYEVSATIEQYFANFIKTGNPNGNGLPRWTATNAADGPQSMQIDVETRTRPSGYEGRYQVLDRLAGQ
jgi:para-nitrobenzyl esterase